MPRSLTNITNYVLIMKLILQLILILLIIGFGTGFYFIFIDNPIGNKIVGVAVLLMAFILLPLFLYYRYKNKNMSDYKLDNNKINTFLENMKM